HDAQSHTVGVSGRDATGDLVDCAAIHKSGRWAGRRMEQIAADLCSPYGITVRAATDTGAALPSWQIQEGESAFECIERLARDRGVLLVSDGQGGLSISRAGTTRIGTALVRGENILAASGTLSLRERFSTYIVKGEQPGTDDVFAEQIRQKAIAADAVVTRHRPLIVLAEDQATAASMKRRAEWERNVRAGRSIDITVTVQGWAHAAGLWEPNRLVRVTDEWLRLDDDLLIKQVGFSLDEQGTRCELALTMPQAFDLIPLPAATKTAKEDNWWNLGN
ncbi:MAG: contractile injection system protein, VgrG/Pvc8 family, partial [Burkholderiales bacterium]|nr:contractile injection system protein, VgrG/Pvc8 family [Burkholderiales bacterium]